jgi:hypothetical protein
MEPEMEFKFEWGEPDFYRAPQLRVVPKLPKEYLVKLSDVELIDLAIQKWDTIYDKLLEQKKLILDGELDEEDWHINQGGCDTCALCKVYLHSQTIYSCTDCPVYWENGKIQGCGNTPYVDFCDAKSIAGAIAAASEAVTYLERIKEKIISESA